MNAGKQMKTVFSNPHPTSEKTESSTPSENDEEETPATSSFEETGVPDEVTTPFQEPDMPMETFESAIQEEDTSVQPFDTEPSPLMDTKQSKAENRKSLKSAVKIASLGDKNITSINLKRN